MDLSWTKIDGEYDIPLFRRMCGIFIFIDTLCWNDLVVCVLSCARVSRSQVLLEEFDIE